MLVLNIPLIRGWCVEFNFVPDWHKGAGISGLGITLKKLCRQIRASAEIAHFEH